LATNYCGNDKRYGIAWLMEKKFKDGIDSLVISHLVTCLANSKVLLIIFTIRRYAYIFRALIAYVTCINAMSLVEGHSRLFAEVL